MEIFLIYIGCYLSFTAIMTIIGITLHDVRMIRRDAKRLVSGSRRKPLVSIIVDDDVAQATVDSIKKNDYRKKEIVFVGEPPRGDLLFYIPHGDTIRRTAISHAVDGFMADTRLVSAEIIRTIKVPTNLREFFRMYQDIALAPFTAVKIAYRIPTQRSRWPLMVRLRIPSHPYRMYMYKLIRWLSAALNAVLFTYVMFMAIWLYEPTFLMAYLGFFGIWMVMAIWHIQEFSLQQKIQYVLFAPASLGYFALLTYIVAVRPLFKLLSYLAAALSLRAFRQHAA